MHKLYAETGTPLLPLLNLKEGLALARNLKIKGKSMKKEEKIVLDRFKTNPFLFFSNFEGLASRFTCNLSKRNTRNERKFPNFSSSHPSRITMLIFVTRNIVHSIPGTNIQREINIYGGK